MSAIVWDDEITLEPVAQETQAETPSQPEDKIVWDDEVTLEPVGNDPISISEQVIKEYPDDLEGAKKELTKRLSDAGIDQEEIKKRTGAFERFQTGVAKTFIEAYNGIVGAEEGDISYDMETRLREEKQQQTDEYKATNLVNKSTPNPDNPDASFFSTEPLFKGTKVGQAEEHATTVGEIAPLAAAGAVGSVAGGVVTGGSTVGSAIGAGIADVGFTSAQAASEQSDVGVGDIALSAVFGAGGATLAKVLAPVGDFTTVSKLPRKQRKAVETMMEKAGMSEKQMNEYIHKYIDITDRKTIDANKAVEVASKGSEVEPSGYILAAMQKDPAVKTKVIREGTTRSDNIAKHLQDDEELYNIWKRSTVTEGKRKATNWTKLQKDLEAAGFEKGDAVYDLVADNAKSLGTRDVELFHATVRPIKPDENIADVPLLKQWSGTARGSIQTQRTASGIQLIDEVLTKVFPNADKKTVDLITKTIKNSVDEVSPRELEEALVKQGIDKVKAKEAANLAGKDFPKRQKEFEKIAKQEEIAGKAIEKGIDKDVAGFNKAKDTMKKDVAKREKEFEKIVTKEETAGKAIEKGVDKDVAEFKKTKQSMEKESARKDVELDKESKQARQDTVEEELIDLLDGVKPSSKEAKELKRAGKVFARDGSESSVNAYLKAKQAVKDMKTPKEEAKVSPKVKEAGSLGAGIKGEQTTIDFEEPNLFNQPAKKKKYEPKAPDNDLDEVFEESAGKGTKKKPKPKKKKSATRQQTPNQAEADRVKEANPDDKEAISKALTRKSIVAEQKRAAEAGLAREKAEGSIKAGTDVRTPAEIKADRSCTESSR